MFYPPEMVSQNFVAVLTEIEVYCKDSHESESLVAVSFWFHSGVMDDELSHRTLGCCPSKCTKRWCPHCRSFGVIT